MANYKGQGTPVANVNDILGILEPVCEQTIYTVPSSDPLFEVFTKEPVDTGAEVEVILLQDANIEQYDADGKNVFKPRDVHMITQYFNEYEHPVYTTTKYYDEIRKVAISPSHANELGAAIVMQNTETRDDQRYIKEKGMLAQFKTDYPTLNAGTATDGKDLTKLIRNAVKSFGYKNSDYLAYNVDHASDLDFTPIKNRAFPDNIRIIVPYKILSTLDIDTLAYVFNLSKTDMLAKIIEIDSEDGIVYVVDKRAWMRKSQLDEMGDFDNPEGRFVNFFLHTTDMYAFVTVFKSCWIDATALD